MRRPTKAKDDGRKKGKTEMNLTARCFFFFFFFLIPSQLPFLPFPLMFECAFAGRKFNTIKENSVNLCIISRTGTGKKVCLGASIMLVA